MYSELLICTKQESVAEYRGEIVYDGLTIVDESICCDRSFQLDLLCSITDFLS